MNDENNPESGRTAGNARNGTGRKTIKGDFGEVEIRTPRDRLSAFKTQIVPRRQRRVGKIDKAIMALYARGMTARDIQSTIQELYDAEVSATLVAEAAGAMKQENGRAENWTHSILWYGLMPW